MQQIHELGRVTLDNDGIRQGKLLGLFGTPFDLRWEVISSWAVGADVMQSRQYPEGRVLQWILELDHPGGTEVVRWGRGEEAFYAFVEALGTRLPGRARAPRVGQSFDTRLPPSIKWMVGPDHDPPR